MTVVDDIKGRLDIFEVVSRYVQLQRSGRSYKALCPYHQEKTPSFFVFPDRQTWRCFGACAIGGDVFSFVMRAENLEFGEVLKQLAQQTGVVLPDQQRREGQRTAFEINESARGYFQQLLASAQGAKARAYLEKRGLSGETIEKFELGLSPSDGESLKNHLVRQGFSSQQLTEAGIVREAQNGWLHDLFRGRLMFPIRNGQGELGGFGGRSLDDSQPKYINSPRSPVFDKGRILYSLYLAKDAARQQGIVVVEGYMDSIAAHQQGFNNVVASMGTALTEHQVSEIRRITKDITLALDPDAAGQQATLRSLESSWGFYQRVAVGQSGGTNVFQSQELPKLKVAVLPDGLDPDEVIRRSPSQWKQLVEDGTPVFDYILNSVSAQVDPATPQGKAQITQAVRFFIEQTLEPFQQDYYFQKLADKLGVTRDTLQAIIGRPTVARTRRAASPSRQATPSAFAKLEGDPLEEYCLALLLRHTEVAEAAGSLRPEYFHRLENREIFHQWARASQDRQGEAILSSLSEIVDDHLAEPLETLLQRELPPLDGHRRLVAFQDVVGRLEARLLRELKTEEEIRFSESPPDLTEEPYLEVLEVNQRIKENQSMRHDVMQNGARRGN